MNCYGNLTRLKSLLDITTTSHDTDLLMLLNVSSREVDKYCHRKFNAESRTKYYDGASTTLDLSNDDALSVMTLKTDEDGDGTFENSLTENTDYYLYPLNTYPKIRVEINSNGNYGGFASGVAKGIQIVGTFGYGDGESATPYTDSAADVNSPTSTSGTLINVDDYTKFAVGETILVDSEQSYLTAVSTSGGLTVTRAVNGTTVATHTSDTSVYIYQYPDPVAQATYMTASRMWKRKDSAYATVIGEPTLGPIAVHQGLDPDVKLLLSDYRNIRWAR